MPGSACRRSSVSPPTDTRSTTSSTVKPRTFFGPPTRNSSSRTTPVSLIRSEEAKILQGVALSKQIQIGGRFPQGWNEIGGPFGAQVEPRAAHRMGEREPGRVQQLPRRERLEALSRLPLGRRDAP